ncbi:MAG: GntR family transcriptional regulator [Thermovirgaceae bacterium]
MIEAIKSDEKAFRQVVSKLVSKHLKPGDRVFEPGLCEELGMSRTPVRQALARLMEAGILFKNPHQKGYVVPELSMEDMRQIFSTRVIIEGECAFCTAEVIGAGELAFLRELNGREEQCFFNGDRHAYAEINEAFHFYLYKICRNPYLQKFATHLYWRSQLYTFHMGFFYSSDFIKERIKKLKESGHVSYMEHRNVIDALESRKPAAARDAMKTHIRRTYEHYAQAKAIDLYGTRETACSERGGGK